MINKINRNIIKRTTALVISMSVLLSVTSCSQLFEKICAEHITEYTDEFFVALSTDAPTAIEKNSKKTVKMPALDELQQSLLDEYLENVASGYAIDDIDVSDDRNSAIVTVTLEDTFVPSDDTEYVGDEDTVKSLVNDTRKTDVSLNIKVNRTDDGWQFADLTEFVSTLYTPYTGLCFIGEDGLPYTMTQEYADSFRRDNLVDIFWYDPIAGNPLGTSSTSENRYLQCVFYFNHPMTMTFVAHLMHNGDEVMTQEVVLDGDIVADCNFGYDPTEETFAPGSYTVTLTMRDFVMAESDALTVR